MLKLYERIKEERIKRGMTQDELAKLTGYSSRGTISRIESGEVDLPQSKIVTFAKALNVSPEYLMGFDDDTQRQDLYDLIDQLPEDKKQIAIRLIKTLSDG